MNIYLKYLNLEVTSWIIKSIVKCSKYLKVVQINDFKTHDKLLKMLKSLCGGVQRLYWSNPQNYS